MYHKEILIAEIDNIVEYINYDIEYHALVISKEKIEHVKALCLKDAQFYFESDPAALNVDEIKLTYPGYLAICYYRLAHELYLEGKRIEARIISEHAHEKTGIDIHPGATIGCPFFIDHGTGVVIGQTSIVGNYVKIYQGVTLGALSPDKGQSIRGVKRHPTIGNNVVIYANASVIGDITIGDDVTIGGSVFLTESVAPNQRVIMDKPKIIYKDKTK